MSDPTEHRSCATCATVSCGYHGSTGSVCDNWAAPKDPESDAMRITEENYHAFPNHATVCVLTLACGFHVSGLSVPVDGVPFDAEAGRRSARRKAVGELVAFRTFRGRLDAFAETKNP